MRKDIIAFCIISLLLAEFIYGQVSSQVASYDIKGYVKDKQSGEALVFANIIIENIKIGATTNNQGHFVIVNAPADSLTLIISYIGYHSKKLLLDNRKGNTKTILVELLPKVFESEEVVVVADEYKIWKSEDEISKIKISPANISSLPRVGETDIFRSLQLLPGISAISDGSAGLYVRGGTPDQNLVLLDGMTIYHVDHFFGFFSAFNSEAIKDIQVYKGGYPAKYGGRLSSVVDLTGKTGNVNDFKMSIGANLLSANAVAEIPFLDKGSILISARRSFVDFIESDLYNSIYSTLSGGESSTTTTPVPGAGRGGQQSQNILPSFYFYDLNAKISYQFTEADFVSLSFYNGADYLDESTDPQQITLRSGNAASTRSTNDLTEWGNLGMSLRWARQWTPRFYSNALVSFSNYYSDNFLERLFALNVQTDSLNYSNPSYKSIQENDVTDLSFKLDNEWNIHQSHKIGFGLQVSSMQTSYIYNVNDTLSILNKDNKAIFSSLYLGDKWALTDRIILDFGLRGTYYDITTDVYIEPRFSFSYSLLDNLKLKGAWGQYYQFVNQVVSEDVLEGNKDFWLLTDETMQPGFAEHFILVTEYETNDYLFSIEGYYKNLNNLFEFSQRIQRNPRDFANNQNNFITDFLTGYGYSTGIEFLVQKKFGNFNGWLSYTLSKVEYEFPAIDDGKPFPADQDRTHEIKIVGTYDIGSWNFSANWIFATGQPYTSPESQYFITLLNGETVSYIHVSDKNVSRLSDYHRLDVSAAYKFKNKSLSGEFGLSVFNLYNQKNVWYKQYDLDVTPITITDVTMLGITPTVFFKINF